MDFSKLAREEIVAVQPYIPGKPVEELQRERGLTQVIKLASNENPHGPGPEVLAVLEKGCRELNRYPDDCVFYLRQALAGGLYDAVVHLARDQVSLDGFVPVLISFYIARIEIHLLHNN